MRISFLYHNGWKVSKIASLSEAQVLDNVRNIQVADDNTMVYAARLLEAAVDFDQHKFHSILDDISARISFERCIVEVCYPYLKKIGLLWSTNNIIPAQEHFSSYIVQNRIIVETEKLEMPPKPPEIILACEEAVIPSSPTHLTKASRSFNPSWAGVFWMPVCRSQLVSFSTSWR